MRAPALTFVSVEEFLDWLELQEEKYELVDGRVVAMTGGTRLHAEVALNILFTLRTKLAGTPCRAYGTDLAVRTGPNDIRFPDVAVFCDPDELAVDPASQTELEKPCVVMEVLSPSTLRGDKTIKLIEYKQLPSVHTMVLVEPRRRVLDVYERVSDMEWRNMTRLPGTPLVLRDPAVTLTPEEIFGPA